MRPGDAGRLEELSGRHELVYSSRDSWKRSRKQVSTRGQVPAAYTNLLPRKWKEKHGSESMLDDARYLMYKALPRSKRPFVLKDFAIVRDIFKLAESFARVESTEVRLTDVLRAYDAVLQRHGMDPTDDTFYYRMLLKLTLRPEHDWWSKLNKQILKSDTLVKANRFRNHKILLYYWLQWRCFHKQSNVREKFAKQASARPSNRRHTEPRDRAYKSRNVLQSFSQLSLKIGNPVKFHAEPVPVHVVELPVQETKTHFVPFLLAQAFSMWHKLIFQVKKSREKKQRKAYQWTFATHHFQRGLLQKGFSIWRDYLPSMWKKAATWWQKVTSQGGKTLSAGYLLSTRTKSYCQLFRHGDFYSIALKRQFLRSLRRRTERMLELKQCFSAMVGGRKMSLAMKFFNIWLERYYSKLQLDLASSKVQIIRKRHVLTGWQIYAYRKASRRAKLFQFMERSNRRLQRSILLQWKIFVSYSLHLQRVRIRLVEWRRGLLQKSAFGFWFIWCQGQQALNKCRKFHFLLSQKRFFLAWKHWYLRQKDKKAIAVSSIRHYFFWHCKRAFLRWKYWICLAVSEKQTSVSLENFRRDRIKVNYWQAWFQMYNNEIIVAQFCSLRKTKTARLLLTALYDYTLEKKERERAVNSYWQLKSLKDVFSQWKGKSWQESRLISAGRINAYRKKLGKKTAHTYFNRWKELTSSQRSENLHVLQIKLRLQSFPDRWNIAAALLASWTCNSAFAVFEIWKHCCRTRIYRRNQNLAALDHLSQVLLLKGFKSLQLAARMARRVKIIKLVSKSKVQAQSLRHMQHLFREKRLAGSMNVDAMLHFEKKVYASVWVAWLKYITSLQSISLANERAYAFSRVMYLRKSLTGWSDVVKKDRLKLQQLARLKVHMEISGLLSTLCGWRDITCHRRLVAKQVAAMKDRRCQMHVFKAFHFWVSISHRQKCSRAASEIRRRRLEKFCFDSWTSFARLSRRKRTAKEFFLKKTLKKLGRTAFLGWQDITRMANHIRVKQSLAASRLRHSQQARAFSLWREAVSVAVFLRQALSHFVLGRTRKQYFRWLEAARCQKKLHAAHSATISFKRVIELRRVLQRWRQATSEHVCCKQQAAKADIFRRNHVLMYVLKSLMDWKARQRQKRDDFYQAKAKLEIIRKRLLFDAWSMQTCIRSEERITLAQLQRMHGRRLMLRALRYLRQLKEENWLSKKQVMQAFALHLENKKISRATSWYHRRISAATFMEWKASVERSKNMRRLQWSSRLRTARRVLAAWRSSARQSNQLRSLSSRLYYYHRIVVLKKFWPLWQSRTHSSRLETQCLVYRCLRKWIEHSEQASFWRSKERQVKFIILRSLKRRIIWAWHSLVREIAVRREQHQQQRLIQREALGMATRTERRQKAKLLHSILASWKEMSGRTNKARHFLSRHNLHQMARIWSQWLVLVGQTQKFKQVKWNWMSGHKRRSLAVWRASTASRLEEGQAVETRAAQIADHRCMDKAWSQWKSFVKLNRERAKVLQNCVGLIQAGQFRDTLKDIMNAWEEYTLHRSKRREQLWTAEAAHKRHKLMDYFAAWGHYTAASIDSAAMLRGSIQLYHRKVKEGEAGPYHFVELPPPSVRDYRQTGTDASQKQHQELIIQEVRNNSPRDNDGDDDDQQQRVKVTTPRESSENGDSTAKSSSETSVTLNLARRRPSGTSSGGSSSSRQLSAERGVYDGVVATEGWPYELPNGGVAWIRCMVEQCTPIQQSWKNS